MPALPTRRGIPTRRRNDNEVASAFSLRSFVLKQAVVELLNVSPAQQPCGASCAVKKHFLDKYFFEVCGLA
jgi:hypothetical protein